MQNDRGVSVIIPVYNREKTIKRAILSVLNQTFTELELIIVDDGSTDSTAQVVQSINDDRLKYIFQENCGACVARNRGISEAKYPFIAFQDSDDLWKKNKLEKQVHILEEMKQVDIVCCKTECKRLDNSVLRSLENQPEGIITEKTGPYGISTQSLLVRRQVFDNIMFDPKVTRYQDLDFLLSAFKNHKIYCVAEYLVEREIGEDSITNKPSRIYDMSIYFQTKHAEIMNDKKQFLSYFLASMLIDAAKVVEKSEKRKYYKKAIELNKSYKIIAKCLLSVFRNIRQD